MKVKMKHQITLLTACGLLTGAALVPAYGEGAKDASAGPPQATPAKKKAAAKTNTPASTQTGFVDNTPLTEEQKIVHTLNRIGFGPRPGDVERVKKMGLSAYIEQQLHPERISDSALDAKLAPVTPYLRLSNEELSEAYAERQSKFVKLIRNNAEKEQLEIKAKAGENGNAAMPGENLQEKLKKAQTLREANLTPEEREAVMKAAQAAQKVRGATTQLAIDKTVRATESEKQLQEVLVDFWSNHFNIDVRKNICGVLKVADEEEVARTYALGKFRDLLGASAKSPAMLVYLDNALSSVPNERSLRQQRLAEQAIKRRAAQGDDQAKTAQLLLNNKPKGGINENYAREIMELHSLGVDGGYSQKDVQEVARCLTGWGVIRRSGEFRFDPNRHDNGAKVVLGHTIPAGGGIKDGEMVLDILASHPSTMRHISTKLCVRLVSDEPPKALVDKCVATWKRTDGDLREVVRTIITSPEFYSRAAYRQKIKSPFEYAVSSARAVGANFDFSPARTAGAGGGMRLAALGGRPAGQVPKDRSVVGQVELLGQPLYQYQAPTGWPEDSRKWVSSGALIARLNYALNLTSGKLVELDLTQARELARQQQEPSKMVDAITKWLVQGEVSPSTRATLLKQATTAPSSDTVAADTSLQGRLVALVLGSPEFQRR